MEAYPKNSWAGESPTPRRCDLTFAASEWVRARSSVPPQVMEVDACDGPTDEATVTRALRWADQRLAIVAAVYITGVRVRALWRRS